MAWNDFSDFDSDFTNLRIYDDYNLPKLDIKIKGSIANRILRADNPKPDFWFKKITENLNKDEEGKKPSDKD